MGSDTSDMRWPTTVSRWVVRAPRTSPGESPLPAWEARLEAVMIGPAVTPGIGQVRSPNRVIPKRVNIGVRGITGTSWCDGYG
jgi:hypothetical protein